MLAKNEEAGEAIKKLEEQLVEFKLQEKKAVEEMKGPNKGRPKSLAFEHQVRTILASGCSARAAQDHVLSSARVYLTSAAFAEYEQHVPNKRWSYPSTPDPKPTSTPKQYFCPSSSKHPQHRFQHQLEALGNEAWLYSMVELARAKEVLQWGFDETSIDGTPTLNQWVLVRNGVLAPSIITIQCAGYPNPYLFCPQPGLLVGSTAMEICKHVEEAWCTGQCAIDLQRAELGGETDDLLAVEGGGREAAHDQGSNALYMRNCKLNRYLNEREAKHFWTATVWL